MGVGWGRGQGGSGVNPALRLLLVTCVNGLLQRVSQGNETGAAGWQFTLFTLTSRVEI